jgi:hypothetical protein
MHVVSDEQSGFSSDPVAFIVAFAKRLILNFVRLTEAYARAFLTRARRHQPISYSLRGCVSVIYSLVCLDVPSRVYVVIWACESL